MIELFVAHQAEEDVSGTIAAYEEVIRQAWNRYRGKATTATLKAKLGNAGGVKTGVAGALPTAANIMGRMAAMRAAVADHDMGPEGGMSYVVHPEVYALVQAAAPGGTFAYDQRLGVPDGPRVPDRELHAPGLRGRGQQLQRIFRLVARSVATGPARGPHDRTVPRHAAGRRHDLQRRPVPALGHQQHRVDRTPDRRLKAMRPGRTQRAAETDALTRNGEAGHVVPLADLKAYCRIYDDADDGLLGELNKAAQDILAGFINAPVGELAVVDFYGRADPRLELSTRVKAGEAVTVNVKVNGADQAVAGHVLDATGDPPAVVFPVGQVFPAPDSRFVFPVSASYTSAAFTGAGEEGLVQAVKALVSEGYHHGGDAMSETRAVNRAVRFLTNRARGNSPGRVYG